MVRTLRYEGMNMRLKRWMTGLGIGVLCATGALVAPGLQAQIRSDNGAATRMSAVRGGIGTFTPAAADPRLAAMLSRSGLPEGGFRFTPSESRSGAGRAVTVAVRARTNRGSQTQIAAVTPSLNLAPVAYNLGVSVGWKRFVTTTDAVKIDLATQSAGRERVDLGMTYTGKRATSRVTGNSARSAVDTPVVLADQPASIDLGGSYSVTRNLAVTAGLRYKNEDQRLPRLTTSDNRRDSQAVYVGTAFRF